MAKKFIVNRDQYTRIDNKMLKIKRLLYAEGGSTLDPESVIAALQSIIKSKSGKENEVPSDGTVLTTEYLYLLSGVKNIKLGPSTGEYFNDSTDFNINFSETQMLRPRPNVRSWKRVSAYGLLQNASSSKIFNSFSDDKDSLERLWLTQSQVMQVCSDPSVLNNGPSGNLFLTKVNENIWASDENLMVIWIIVKPTYLYAKVFNFLDDHIWPVEKNPRIFVPKQLR